MPEGRRIFANPTVRENLQAFGCPSVGARGWTLDRVWHAMLVNMSVEHQKLKATIAALEAQRSLLGDEVVDASIAALRARIDTERAVLIPELKQISILFLDIVGSTMLSQNLDPEDIGELIDGSLTRATTIVTVRRGRVLQYAGDSLLAVFGAQEAREDDAIQAVQCGLELLELGRQLATEIHAARDYSGFGVRVGVHSGRVLLGGGVDDDSSIRGIAVNIAARMEQTAPTGGLRISRDTYMQVRGVFDVALQEPLLIKGIDTPVSSYLVEGIKPRAFRIDARGIEGIATRMVGRDRELGFLQEAFERLIKPRAGFDRVVVVAEPGIGKSRLLYEFCDWVDSRPESVHVFEARATPQTQGEAYGLLRDLFARRLEIADSDAMEVAKQKFEIGLEPLFATDKGLRESEAHIHLLGQLIGLDYAHSTHIRGIKDDGRQIRSRGFLAAAQMVRRMAGQGGLPVLFYLDDLQWADDASLDFLDYLAGADNDVPVLLVCLTRPALFERRPDQAAANRRVSLQPLDKELSRRLSDELFQKLPEVPADLRGLVISGAGGNPYYMEELVKMLVHQGTIDASKNEWAINDTKRQSLHVPSTLGGVLQATLDALPARERHALRLASVIGLEFWDAALAHVEMEAATELGQLVRRELVYDQHAERSDDIREYAFRHQILHQVTYDTVLKRIKRHAHAKTAQWIAEHSGARAKALLGTAAEHFEKAGDTANAAEFYARAAVHMASTFANDAALDYASRALALAPPDADELRWRLIATRERTLDLLGRRTDQAQDIETLFALAESIDDDVRRGEAAWRRSDIALRTADYAVAECEARRALRFAESAGADELSLRAIHRLSVAVARLGNPAEGRAIAEAGLVRAQELGLPPFGLTNAATICVELQGDLVAFLHYVGLSLSFARANSDRRTEAIELGNLGMAHALLGDFQEGRANLDEALRRNRELGNRLSEGNNLIVLSEIAWLLGEDSLALEQAKEAIAIQIEVDSRFHLSNAFRVLGNAELALGRSMQAVEAFGRSEKLARDLGQSPTVLNSIEGQIRTALSRGDDAEACRLTGLLLAEAGLDPTSFGQPTEFQPEPFVGADEHLIRSTLCDVWSRAGDARAAAALCEAHRALQANADRIIDGALRRSFLDHFPAHRKIVAAWQGAPASTKENGGTTVSSG